MRLREVAVVIAVAASFTLACDQPKVKGRAMSSWMHDLDADEEFKRRNACEALAEIGPAAKGAIPRLVELLEDVNPGLQEFAREALVKIGPDSIAPLEALLDRDEPAVRLHGAAGLVGIDPQHQKGSETLVAAVVGIGNAQLAEWAQETVIKMREGAVPLLLPYLDDSYAPVRMQVVKTLGKIGEPATDAVDPLSKIAKEDKELDIRLEAITALARIGPKEKVRPTFESLLEDPLESVGSKAGAMLQYIGAREGTTGMEGADDIERTVTDGSKLSAETIEPDPDVEEEGVVKKKSKKKKKKKKVH